MPESKENPFRRSFCMSSPTISDPLSPATLRAATSLSDSSPCAQDAEEVPVTVLVSRRIRAGREEAFEERLQALNLLLKQQDGFREMKAYKPGTPDDEHKVMLHFASARDLERWQQSPQREAWLQSVRPLEAEAPRAQILTGLETWFTLPGQEGLQPPPAHKMGFVTWLGIFPLVTAANLWVVPHLDPLPPIGKSAITTALTVTLMTYGVMPRLTKLCARFLYPEIELPHPKKAEKSEKNDSNPNSQPISDKKARS